MASQFGLTLAGQEIKPLPLSPVAEAEEEVTGPPQTWPVLTDPRFRSFLRHWAQNRAGLVMPRAAIDPVAIRGCLANVWLYQYLPEEEDFLCTLAGEAVNLAWGQSLMGRRISQFMSPVMLGQVPALYRRMMAMPAIQVSRRQISPASGVEQGAERLIVPLADPEGRPWGVFGLTLYQLGGQARITDPAALQGQVTLYPCAELPPDLP
jgi:hypothetical protein